MTHPLAHVPISEQGLQELATWLSRPPQLEEVEKWIYVGTWGTTEGATQHSPPFQNSAANAGGGKQRLRFGRKRRARGIKVNQLVVEGVVTAAAGTVVTTLPASYRPRETQFGLGSDETSVYLWQLDANGDLTFIGAVTSSGSSTPSGPAGGDLAGSYPDPDVAVVDDDVLGSGTPDGTTFLRGDRVWAVPPDTGGTWSVLTNGDPDAPELIFAGGDVVMVHIP